MDPERPEGRVDATPTAREPDPQFLVNRANAVVALVDDAAAIGLQSSSAAGRVNRLRDHLRAFVLPRASSLDAPLVALLFGPTGAGKSSLANSIARDAVSATGVLRPTTREAVVVATQGDRDALLRGPFKELETEAIRWRDVDWPPGIAVVDSPDIDSVETANRELTDRLIEAADLAVLVTTATRYADRVPWTVLRRVAERRLPLLVVVNRLPADEQDRAAVIEDVRRLLAEAALTGADERGGLTLVPVGEGDVERPQPAVSALSADAVLPVTDRIAALRADAVARRRLAAKSLAGALVGLEPLLQSVADDLEREAIDVEALRRAAESAYRNELMALREELRSGLFLRTEVLRRWQDFVGADRLTRSISAGMTKFETTMRSAMRPPGEPPVAAIRDETRAELAAAAEAHASEAARRTAGAWVETSRGAPPVEADPALWGASDGFRERLAAAVEEWLAGIESAIAATGEPKRQMARGAALGVNAAGVGVMLAVFLHTGGLTGAEMGVAAGTALLNQRLLEAIFGEAAIVRLVQDATKKLDAVLASAFEAEERRFAELAPEAPQLRELAASLRNEGFAIAAAAKAVEGGEAWAVPAGEVRVETGGPPARFAGTRFAPGRAAAARPSPAASGPARRGGLLDVVRGFILGDRSRD